MSVNSQAEIGEFFGVLKQIKEDPDSTQGESSQLQSDEY